MWKRRLRTLSCAALVVVGLLVYVRAVSVAKQTPDWTTTMHEARHFGGPSRMGHSDYQFEYEQEYETRTGNIYHTDSSFCIPPSSSFVATIATMGAMLVALSVLLFLRRFSLMILMFVTMLVAASVALPLAYYTPVPKLALIELNNDESFTTEEMARMEAAIQPAAAKVALPAGFLRELSIPLEDVVVSPVRLSENVAVIPPESLGIYFWVELPDGVDLQTACAIVAFYQDYASILAIETIRAKGLTMVNHPQSTWMTKWSKWRKEWEAKRAKPAAATAAPQPTP